MTLQAHARLAYSVSVLLALVIVGLILVCLAQWTQTRRLHQHNLSLLQAQAQANETKAVKEEEDSSVRVMNALLRSGQSPLALAHAATLARTDPMRALELLQESRLFPASERDLAWRICFAHCGHVCRIKSDAGPGYVSLSEDGSRLATYSPRQVAEEKFEATLTVYETGEGRELWKLTRPCRPPADPKQTTFVRLSPNGEWLAAVGADDEVLLLEARSGKPREPYRLPGASVRDFRFDTAGEWLAVSDLSGKVHLLDLKSGKSKGGPKLEGDSPATVRFEAFAGPSTFQDDPQRVLGDTAHVLVIHSEKGYTFWDPTAGRECVIHTPFSGVGPSASRVAERHWIAYLHRSGPTQLQGSRRDDLFVSPPAYSYPVGCTPDGRLLIGRRQNGYGLYDSQTGEERVRLAPSSFLRQLPETIEDSPEERRFESGAGLAISGDGSTVVFGRQDCLEVLCWKGRHGRTTFGGSGCGVAFSDDGKRLATGGVANVGIWELASGKRLAYLDGFNADIRYVRLAFHRDGAGLDVMTRFGDLFRGRVGPGLDTDTIHFKNAPADSLIPPLPEPGPESTHGPQSPIDRVISDNGRWRLTCCRDGVVVSHVPTRRVCFVLPTPDCAVSCLALSADGRLLAAGGAKRTYVWEMPARE